MIRPAKSPISRILAKIFGLIPGLFLVFLLNLSACAPTRKPVPPGEIPKPRTISPSDEQYGHQVLAKLSEKYPIDYNHPRLNNIVDIVDRLTKAADANKDPWHVYLLKDDKFKNAAATRGNHVFIWTAMLDNTENDAELAAILAHEISHVLAGHTEPDPNEALKKMLIGLGAVAANIAVSRATSSPSVGSNLGRMTGSLTQQVGEGFLVNPYSRKDEYEADRVGMLLMAEAGFNPKAALTFWERASQDPDFSSSIAFFSTHPPAQERLNALQQELPRALERFEKRNRLGPVSTADSFNVSTRHTPKVNKPPRADRNLKTGNFDKWEVTATKAVLYKRPTTNSRALGEYPKGAVVKVVGRKFGWLEVLGQDRGYLRAIYLKPVP